MCFSDSSDSGFFLARTDLYLDLDLWNLILKNSGLFDIRGHHSNKEFQFWVHTGQTISFDHIKLTTGKFAICCCNAEVTSVRNELKVNSVSIELTEMKRRQYWNRRLASFQYIRLYFQWNLPLSIPDLSSITWGGRYFLSTLFADWRAIAKV